MNIDPNKLEQRINEIPKICENGKKAIKKLFEDGFGVVFQTKKKVEFGDIYIDLHGDEVIALYDMKSAWTFAFFNYTQIYNGWRCGSHISWDELVEKHGYTFVRKG